MGNILFQNNPKPQNPLMPQINRIQSLGPSNMIFNQMYKNNPQFKNFADSMYGKTPEQAFKENGLDFNKFSQFKW